MCVFVNFFFHQKFLILYLGFLNLVQMFDLLYYVKENQPPPVYISLYLSIFLSLQSKFLSQISQLLWEPESSNFVYIMRVTKFILGKQTKMLRFIFALFLPYFSTFPLSHLSSLQCNTDIAHFTLSFAERCRAAPSTFRIKMGWPIKIHTEFRIHLSDTHEDNK